MQERAHLILIAFPPAMVGAVPRALVRDHRAIADDVPPVARGLRAGAELVGDGEVARGGRDPVEERLPDLRAPAAGSSPWHTIESLRRVVRADRDLLAPVRVEEIARIEVEEPRQELAKRAIGPGADRSPGGAEELRQLEGAQREARDDAPAAAAAALQRPEELRM